MNWFKTAVLLCILFNLFLSFQILNGEESGIGVNFLDVGQGDSIFIESNGIRMITDAGPSKKISESLGRFTGTNKYIDLALITHPEKDHFNGFNYLLSEYDFGAFIINGSDPDSKEWKDLINEIRRTNIPLIVLGEGDSIALGDMSISILSPGINELQSAELNDAGIVQLIRIGEMELLLSSDIGEATEERLVEKYGNDMDVDIFKVPHHGSKYSSSLNFLNILTPRISLVGVGEGNTYGHPSKEAVARIGSVGSQLLRTDLNGNIRLVKEGDRIMIFADTLTD